MAKFGWKLSGQKSKTVRPNVSRLVKREGSFRVDDDLQFLLKRKRRKENLHRGLPRPSHFQIDLSHFAHFLI